MDSSDEGSKVGNEKGGRSENETPGVDSSDKCSSVGSRVEGDQDSEVQEPAEMHPAILSGDFGRVVGLKAQRKVTDSEKFFLLLCQGRATSFPLAPLVDGRGIFKAVGLTSTVA